MRRNIAPLVVLVLAATQTAVSAQTTTVQSLMDDGYTVAGVNTSAAGGGAYTCRKATHLFIVMSLRSPARRRSQPNIASR